MANPSGEERLVRLAAILVLKSVVDKAHQEGSIQNAAEGYGKIRSAVTDLHDVLRSNKDVEAKVLLKSAASVAAEAIRFMVDVVLKKAHEKSD